MISRFLLRCMRHDERIILILRSPEGCIGMSNVLGISRIRLQDSSNDRGTNYDMIGRILTQTRVESLQYRRFDLFAPLDSQL